MPAEFGMVKAKVTLLLNLPPPQALTKYVIVRSHLNSKCYPVAVISELSTKLAAEYEQSREALVQDMSVEDIRELSEAIVRTVLRRI